MVPNYSARPDVRSQAVDRDRLLASVCRDSYYQFVRTMWHTVIPETPTWNWHIPFVCDEIQACCERIFRGEPREYDLLSNQPPGTSKSSLFSIFLTPWAWTRMPSFRCIGASYAQPLALDLARKSRDVVKSDLYRRLFPHVRIRDDQDTKTYFMNTAGGFRYAVGSNGSVTGMHAHVIVPDDPIDPLQSVSDAEIARTNYWIEKTLLSRKVDRAVSVVMMVMQRLSEEDPSAQMLRRGRKRARHLRLPATDEYEISPPEVREHYAANGGLLDPVRLPKSVLRDAHRELSDVGYAGQFGQNPVPPEGGMFKVENLRTHDPSQPVPPFVKVVRYWDKAGSPVKGLKKSRAAYTTGVKLGATKEGEIYVLDVIRVRLDSWARERLIRRTARLDGLAVVVGQEREPGSGGLESAQRTAVKTLHGGFRVRTLLARGDKTSRADPFSVEVNKGSVVMVKADWNRDYVRELKYFPHGSYKDQVDASAGAFSCLGLLKRKAGGLRRRNPSVFRTGFVG